MKKTALLIDGGWFSKGLGSITNIKSGWPTAEQVLSNAKTVLAADEEIFRIFYYDCPPFDGEIYNPISRKRTNY
jgi:hypothetical protein